jgi:thiamine biosynthesis lipoprotein
MKIKLLPLITVLPLLISCHGHIEKRHTVSKVLFYFDTAVEIKVFDGTHDTTGMIEGICYNIDRVTDDYTEKSKEGIYAINHDNNKHYPSDYLREVVSYCQNIADEGATNFNYLMGSLNKKWKEAIENKTVLAQTTIDEELAKIASSSVVLEEEFIQRLGDAEIDLGAIVKGYALDKIKGYLDASNTHKYLINAGSSSILLGEKDTKDGLFTVGLEDVKNAYLELKNCFVSTSSISKQSEVIEGVTYSHIVNPSNGSATPINDAVIVINDKGYLGDALSTSMMNNTIDEIKAIETAQNVKAIVINDGKIDYANSFLEVKYH